jgi:hypothetical protein
MPPFIFMPTYNKTISVFFVFVFCYSGMRPTFPLFNYVINYDYIAEVLCINKEKEILQCNGTCQLTKEILENEPTGTSEYPQPSFEKFPTLFLEKRSSLRFKQLSCTSQLVFYNPLNLYNNDLSKPLLPPPQVVMCI